MNNPEDNKKQVAKRMLTEAMENIDFSKVTAMSLALKFSDNKEPNKEPNKTNTMCSECGPNKECECNNSKEANDSY